MKQGQPRRIGGVLVVSLLSAVLTALVTRHSSPAARTPLLSRSTTAASSSGAAPAKYGGLPSWLPKATVPVGKVVKADGAHPVLAIEGDAVAVDLAGARVLATAVGPSVPQNGRGPVPSSSPCTFVVTFAHASGVIPLSARAFTFIDELGHVRHPQVTALVGGGSSRTLTRGHTLSLSLRDVLPTGNGRLTWAPDGGQPIVSWDFAVELD
jgi:hypothetical protein